jgi:6-phosphogluconolactonase
MHRFDQHESIRAFDERRDVVIPGDAQQTIEFCVKQFIQLARSAIRDRGVFTVALSGGSTPNALFKRLASEDCRNALDWKKIRLFWSDERSVPPDDPQSNYYTAMESGLSSLSIPKENIFRMKAEVDIETNAAAYEKEILTHVPEKRFDLVMLGMGEDGHTASLFPWTNALHSTDRLVAANYIPQKNTWRMTLTYECIHSAALITIYVIGKNKAEMVKKVFSDSGDDDSIPIRKVGIPSNKALWILDNEASEALVHPLPIL